MQYSPILSWLFTLLLLGPRPAPAGEETPLHAGPTRFAGTPPREALAMMRLVPGFRLELVLHEPDVADPVAVSWDARGRLWVVEMGDYPSASPAGRVRVLEDSEGDGRFEKNLVFTEKLPFPTSVLPYQNGVFVTAAPEVLFLEEDGATGRAGASRVIITGFHEGNTQLRVNNLLWGIDGRVWGANGRSGGKIRRPETPRDRAVDIGGRDFRFDPATGEPEAVAGASQFGHGFDEWGRRFLSWNTIHVRQQVLLPRDLERHPRLARTECTAPISDHGDDARIYPIAPAPRTFNNEPTDRFNASCGLTIECGGVFPPVHAGCAYVCEPLVGLVHRDVLEPGPGPTLVARRGEGEKESEFLASADPWFHPVNLRSGPDGALYVVDFYREMVEHPEYVARELRAGVDFARGRGHGRIWRVVPEGVGLLPVEDLSALSAPELVARLESPNGRVRETAQRLLLERRDPAAVKSLRLLARLPSRPVARAWALWTLNALGALDPAVLEPALSSPEARLRETALRVARERSELLLSAGTKIEQLAADEDPCVRLQVALALGDLRDRELDGKFSFDPPRVRALARIAIASGDEWTSTAVLSSLRGREVAFLEALAAPPGGAPPAAFGPRLAHEAARLAGAGANAGGVRRVLAVAITRLPAARGEAFALADGLALGLKLEADSRALLSPAGGLAREWYEVWRAARDAAGDARVEGSIRALAAAALAHAPWDVGGEAIRGLLDPKSPLDLQTSAVRALGTQEAGEAGSALLAAWSAATPGLRGAILDALLARPGRAQGFLLALEAGDVNPREIDLSRRAALLNALPADARARLEARFRGGAGRQGGEGRASVVLRYREKLPETGDASKGAAVFASKCAPCHRFAAAGHAVGPDLAGSARKPREDFLVAVLDPNRAAEPGYAAYALVLEGGQVLTGILASETSQAVTLRRPGGIEDVIPRSGIRSIESTGVSLMPEGLEAELAPADFADLLEFLKGR